MTRAIYVQLQLSELQSVLRALGHIDNQLRRDIRGIFFRELKSSKSRLVQLTKDIQTSGEGGKFPPGTYKRMGDLNRSAYTQLQSKGNEITGSVGFSPFLQSSKSEQQISSEIYTQTHGATISAHNKSGLLTFPIYGATPLNILPYYGKPNVLRTLIRQASKIYYLIWLDNVVLGRKLHSKSRELTFLFARAPSVYVPQRIDLSRELELLSTNIVNAVDQLSWNWSEIEK